MLRLFLSYRRDDTAGKYLAHMIYRELRRRYGEGAAFLDVDARSPGLSFPNKVRTALDSSDAVLVVIGPEWLNQLKARQDDQRDWVRYEVSESLKRPNLPVVPVCHGSTPIPSPTELPPELQDLAWRDGVALDPFIDFDAHLTRLLADLERVVLESRGSDAPAAPAAAILPATPTVPVEESAKSQPASSISPTDTKGIADVEEPKPKQPEPGSGASRGLFGWLKSEPSSNDSAKLHRYRQKALTMRGLGFSPEEIQAHLQSIGATLETARAVVGAVFAHDA